MEAEKEDDHGERRNERRVREWNEERGVTKKEEREREGDGGSLGWKRGKLLGEHGKKALAGHSSEITMPYKSLPNLLSYY